jgi:osmotically-inducible protein OsmY
VAVEVEVHDGVVRLAGRVRRRSQAEALEKMTGSIHGVVAVESRLTWPVDDIDDPLVPPEPAPLL